MMNENRLQPSPNCVGTHEFHSDNGEKLGVPMEPRILLNTVTSRKDKNETIPKTESLLPPSMEQARTKLRRAIDQRNSILTKSEKLFLEEVLSTCSDSGVLSNAAKRLTTEIEIEETDNNNVSIEVTRIELKRKPSDVRRNIHNILWKSDRNANNTRTRTQSLVDFPRPEKPFPSINRNKNRRAMIRQRSTSSLSKYEEPQLSMSKLSEPRVSQSQIHPFARLNKLSLNRIESTDSIRVHIGDHMLFEPTPPSGNSVKSDYQSLSDDKNSLGLPSVPFESTPPSGNSVRSDCQSISEDNQMFNLPPVPVESTPVTKNTKHECHVTIDKDILEMPTLESFEKEKPQRNKGHRRHRRGSSMPSVPSIPMPTILAPNVEDLEAGFEVVRQSSIRDLGSVINEVLDEKTEIDPIITKSSKISRPSPITRGISELSTGDDFNLPLPTVSASRAHVVAKEFARKPPTNKIPNNKTHRKAKSMPSMDLSYIYIPSVGNDQLDQDILQKLSDEDNKNNTDKDLTHPLLMSSAMDEKGVACSESNPFFSSSSTENKIRTESSLGGGTDASILLYDEDADTIVTWENNAPEYSAWTALKDEYALGYGYNNTLSFKILGTNGEDDSCAPHVLSPPLMESLANFFPESIQCKNFWLKYSLTRDGSSLAKLLRNVRGSEHTILAIETTDGQVFGSFTSCAWRKYWGYFGNGECFVWKMRQSRLTNCFSVVDQAKLESEIEVFGYSGKNECYQACRHDLLAVGGGSEDEDLDTNKGGGFAISLSEDLSKGTSNVCPTFNSPPLTNPKAENGDVFDVLNIEVWAFTPFENEEEAERCELGKMFIGENSYKLTMKDVTVGESRSYAVS